MIAKWGGIARLSLPQIYTTTQTYDKPRFQLLLLLSKVNDS